MPRHHKEWTGRFPPGSPAEWIAAGHVTCQIQCHRCDNIVDIRLETLPPDQPWSAVGGRLVCSGCGTTGAVNVTPNWHDAQRSFWRARR